MKDERLNWFIERIGVRVFRNLTTCNCSVCKRVYEIGLIINSEMHANYLYEIESELTEDGFPLRYFDTIEEAKAFDLTLI